MNIDTWRLAAAAYLLAALAALAIIIGIEFLQFVGTLVFVITLAAAVVTIVVGRDGWR